MTKWYRVEDRWPVAVLMDPEQAVQAKPPLKELPEPTDTEEYTVLGQKHFRAKFGDEVLMCYRGDEG